MQFSYRAIHAVPAFSASLQFAHKFTAEAQGTLRIPIAIGHGWRGTFALNSVKLPLAVWFMDKKTPQALHKRMRREMDGQGERPPRLKLNSKTGSPAQRKLDYIT